MPWVIALSQRISCAGYSPLPLYQRHNSQHDEIAVVSPLGGSGWMLHSEWPRSSAYDGHNGTEDVAITEDGRIFRMNGFDRGVRLLMRNAERSRTAAHGIRCPTFGLWRKVICCLLVRNGLCGRRRGKTAEENIWWHSGARLLPVPEIPSTSFMAGTAPT